MRPQTNVGFARMFRAPHLLLSGMLIASTATAQVRLKPDTTQGGTTRGGTERSTAEGGAINPPLSPRNANYTIDASLEPATRTITGRELITWRNISTKTATEPQFHLYWNAWRDNRSTWLREASLAPNRHPASPR